MEHASFDLVAKNLADVGAISLEDYIDAPAPLPSQPTSSPSGPLAHLHQACQRALRNTDALKFEFIEQNGSKNKQCILTITKPDGVQRSYATQPVFSKKNEAKVEVAKIAIDMGALDFLASNASETNPIMPAETSSADNPAPSDATSLQPMIASETFVHDIEECCLQWRAAHVIPHWVPFFDSKLLHKQGCALRIQLSPHVVRVYLSDPSFDNHLDAKGVCAKAAISEGVLDFIKHGNGQTRPSSPDPSPSFFPSPPLPVAATTPWTLQGFHDSLPKPFPESFPTNNASEINALGWLNTMVQNARGGKLISSFFFTSDGPPGLHGCLLKLDRPGEYKAFLVDARFLKRSDAKAAVCLQAMSGGFGNYIRSITSALDTKTTFAMRSFANNLVYPALTTELNKIGFGFYPQFEYDKERDAFGASLVVRLSTSPTPEQVRRYTVPRDYRSKADAKVGVICHAADQGVIEFVRFRGGTPPAGYTSPYVLHTYDPDTTQKRKHPGSAEDAGQDRPAKKKKKGKRRAEVPSYSQGSRLAPLGQYLSVRTSCDQIHGISRPSDMGLSQSVPAVDLCDPSQLGVGNGNGSGAARPVVYGRGLSYNVPGAYGGGPYPPRAVDAPPPESVSPLARPGGSSRVSRPPVKHAELEPGEVLSESEFSESSSRNDEDNEVRSNERDASASKNENGTGGQGVDVDDVARGSQDKGKGKETSTMVSRDGLSATATPSHVKNLIDYCAMHHCGTPSFHETQSQGRFQVWIVIGKERFDLPATYGSAEEGRQRVAKQVVARLCKVSSGNMSSSRT